jgi:hypothetical protein
MLLSLISALGWTGIARAVDVPPGKAAVAEAVIGKAQVFKGGALKALALHVGDALDFGDRVATGENGRIFLRLANLSVSRLAANTEMTLDAAGKRQGTFLTLVKGWARFLVGQRAPGDAFEVGVANAVAAVKGTDWEAGSDGGEGHVYVYDSEHQPALSYSDPNGGQGVDLDPGQGADFNGSLFTKIDALDKSLRDDPNGRYLGLPVPDGQQNAVPQDDKAPQALIDLHQLLSDSIQKSLADAQHDLDQDQQQTKTEQKDLKAAGRYAIDSGGYGVQISCLARLNDARTTEVDVANTRASGPNMGTSFASEIATWNADLPGNWGDVMRLGLNDPSNIDPNTGWASYWRTSDHFTAANPYGDTLWVDTLFDTPFYVGGSVAAGNPLFQSFSQIASWKQGSYGSGGAPSVVRSAGLGAPGGTNVLWDYSLFDSNLTQDPATGHWYSYAADVATEWSSGYLSVTDNLTGGGYAPYSSADGNGNYTYYSPYYYSYGNNSSISLGLTALNPDGSYATMPAAVANNGYNGTLADMKGLDPGLNVELNINWYDTIQYSSPTHSIDLLVMPQFFDLMDVIPAPPPSACIGGC